MKRLLSLFTAATLFFSLLSPALADEADYKALYAPVLASILELLTSQDPDNHIPGPGETGIREIRYGLEPMDALRDVGYAMEDLSGDGIPELLIAQADGAEGYGKRILAMYTCIGSSPSLIVEGWGRNRYYLLPDGSILNEGASGAAYSCLGLFRLSANALELEWLDFFFTDLVDDKLVTYHNSDGIWDAAYAGNELVDVDFWRLTEIMEADIQSLKLTAFYDYQAENPPSLVVPQWYPEGFLEDFRQITLSNEEYSAKIALCACSGVVTDLQLLSLELEDMDEGGSPRFRQEVLETVPSLEPGVPLVVQLAFGCAIPNFGILYTDNTGTTRTYSIMQSGMDGSLLMNEME